MYIGDTACTNALISNNNNNNNSNNNSNNSNNNNISTTPGTVLAVIFVLVTMCVAAVVANEIKKLATENAQLRRELAAMTDKVCFFTI